VGLCYNNMGQRFSSEQQQIQEKLSLGATPKMASIAFVPMQVIPIAGMVAGNAMVAVGLCYNNMGQRFSSEQQQIQEKLSLGATPKMAS
ncbi:ABC transporter permease, partial [Enterobacter hormaechei]|uniref:ABC transporter permease n=1 Tax=Enterobacter hormaechei TaxID=158836 RepID=UPI001F0A3E5C